MGKITRLLSLAAFVMFGSNIICAAATYPKNKGKGIVYPTAVEYNVEYDGTTKINDIQKIDYSHGWAVGNDGLVLKKSGSWTAVNLGLPVTDPQTNYNFNAVHCLESNNLYIWVVGENKSDNNGIIRRSTDGGTTWLKPSSMVNLPTGTSFKGVSFSGNGTGYIACSNGMVLTSNDYGASWVKTGSTPVNDPVKDPNGVSIHYQDVFTDPMNSNNVRVIGDNYGLLAISTDGGNTWPTQSVNALPSAVASTYKWPSNTLFNVPLALGPTDMAADGVMLGNAWNNYGVTYNHGYFYNGSTLSKVAPDAIWLNGADFAGNSNAVSGSDGYTVYGDGAGNAADMTAATVYPTGNVVSHRSYSASDGKVYSTYYPPYAVDASCAPTGVARQIKVEWSSMYSLDASRIEIYRCESPIGMPSLVATVGGSATSYVDNYANYYMDYHYWVKPVNGSGTDWIYAYYCKPSCGDTPASAPAAPTNVTATDVADDHGESVLLTWSGTTTFYHVGRRVSGTSVYYPIVTTSANSYYDNSAKNGVTYEYVVIAEQGNSFTPSVYSDMVTCTPADNLAPAQLPMQTGYFDAASRIITLSWQESTDDPNLGGYWVCPELLGEFGSDVKGDPGSYTPDAYHVEHAAPLQRTTYSYYVPDNYLGQTLGFSVTAMDRSGNIGPWSQTYWINTKAFTNSNYAKATAYNNGRHLLYDGSGNLHLTYTSGDSVLYQKSLNDGYTWTASSGFASGGTNPHSAAGIYGSDTVMVWTAEANNGGWTLKTAKRVNNGWSSEETLLDQTGGFEQDCYIGPPAMAVNSTGTHLVIERKDIHYSPGTASSGFWTWKLLYGFRAAGGSTFAWTGLDSASGSWNNDPGPGTTSPSICIDAKGGIHVAWDYDGEIYWKMNDPYIKGWRAKVNVSNSEGVSSDEPSLAYYGDVHLVWQEGSDISHKKGNWGYATEEVTIDAGIVSSKVFGWGSAENVSNSSATASLNPVFDGNYIAWSEQSAAQPEQYNASFASYADRQWTVETDYSKNPTQPAVFPQIAYYNNSGSSKMTVVWTEGAGPCYSLIARDSTGVSVTPQLSAELGGEEASIYTIERDGYLTYSSGKSKSSGITVDYDSTALKYYLPSLDKDKINELKIGFYQEYDSPHHQAYNYMISINGIPLGAVKVPSGQKVTFEKVLPPPAVRDGEAVLKIENLTKPGKKGIVTCDWWELYSNENGHGHGHHGGCQSDLSEAQAVSYKYELGQNAPNPASGQTAIRYQLSKPGSVSLKVYNTLGQAVRTLVDQNQTPGYYSVNWDGKDDLSRQTSAGIYFYRIVSGEFNATKKMVVLR